MTALAEIRSVESTLDELAAQANREHALAQQAGESMVRHAISAGEALLYAKGQVPGEWLPWLRENFAGSERLGQCYMRLAQHSDVVLDHGATSLRSGLALIAYEGRASWGMAAVSKARRMYSTGQYTHAQLAEEFGVSKPTMTRWLDRKTAQKDRARSRRDREARRALARRKDETAARKIGGPIAEAYSLVRRTLQAVERAHGETEGGEVKTALASAMHRLYAVEDEIGKAVRLS